MQSSPCKRVHFTYIDYYNNNSFLGKFKESVHKTIVTWHGEKNLCLVKMRGQLIFMEYVLHAKCFIFSGMLEPVCASSYVLVRGDCYVFRNLASHFLNCWKLEIDNKRNIYTMKMI